MASRVQPENATVSDPPDIKAKFVDSLNQHRIKSENHHALQRPGKRSPAKRKCRLPPTFTIIRDHVLQEFHQNYRVRHRHSNFADSICSADEIQQSKPVFCLILPHVVGREMDPEYNNMTTNRMPAIERVVKSGHDPRDSGAAKACC